MKTYRYQGKNHKIFMVCAFGAIWPVIVVKREYNNGSLALEALTLEDIGEGYYELGDSFGFITVNLGPQPDVTQYVKNYSENEGWAEALAQGIGGIDTGGKKRTGFVEVPLYDFSNLNIYA